LKYICSSQPGTLALILERDGKLRGEYARDELHLSAAGYAALNAELSRTLAELETTVD